MMRLSKGYLLLLVALSEPSGQYDAAGDDHPLYPGTP